jgi:hypothetical protein
MPSTRVDSARTLAENIPPRAMPASKAMRDIGDTRYSCRFPVSFSQYNCEAMPQRTLSQHAVIAPPRTTNPSKAGSAPSAR